MMDLAKNTGKNELLLIQVGPINLALPLKFVNSIQSAKSIAGEQLEDRNQFSFKADGEKTQLADLSVLFEQQTGVAGFGHKKLILVETGKNSLGLIVDNIGRVVSADSSRIRPLPQIFEDPPRICFPGVLMHEDSLFLVLSPDGIAELTPVISEPRPVPDTPGHERSSHLTAVEKFDVRG